tara:strand:- start:494 stop:1072 length:579 start_codon:yes stop_codon:yes gene_type:complete
MNHFDKTTGLIPKVLLVDDEQAFGRAVQRHLEKDGYFCEHVCSLEGAREFLMTQSPSLLILDMKLPDGSGLQLLEEIEEKRDFPVLVLTAYATVNNAVAAMKMKACDYLSKPIDLDALSKLVFSLVGEWNTSAKSATERSFQTLADIEQAMIRAALMASKGNVSKAARNLGLGRMALRHRIKKYEIIYSSDN